MTDCFELVVDDFDWDAGYDEFTARDDERTPIITRRQTYWLLSHSRSAMLSWKPRWQRWKVRSL